MANLINVLILLLVNLIELHVAHPVPVPGSYKQIPNKLLNSNLSLINR